MYAVNRNNADYDGDGNQISTTYAKQTGSYPTLGAGHLQHQGISSTSTSTIGWYKVGTTSASKIVGGNGSVSVIFLVNGVYQIESTATPSRSGLLELDVTKLNGNFTTFTISVLGGALDPEQFFGVLENNVVTLYWRNVSTFGKVDFTILTQQDETLGNWSDLFEFDTAFYGTSAPSGAVYAVVRNNASADANGYSFDTNYVWHNNGQPEENTLKDGTTSLDFNDYLEEGKYELHGYADNPAVNFPTSSLNMSETNCDWYLVVYVRGTSYVTQVAYSVRADGSIAIRTLRKGTWGNWRLLFDSGVAQQIPAASQTVLGGVKVYTDSEGYFCIDTQ